MAAKYVYDDWIYASLIKIRLLILLFPSCSRIAIVFFFKQKTAYEIGVRLVGSEMCIRDRPYSTNLPGEGKRNRVRSVSYTHLTLPTKRIV